jgi:hypothetical protein
MVGPDGRLDKQGWDACIAMPAVMLGVELASWLLVLLCPVKHAWLLLAPD